MPMTDPLGDMLTRIRNGQQARKDSILTPASKLRANVLDVLQREGYIRGYNEEELAGQRGLRIELKYFEGQRIEEENTGEEHGKHGKGRLRSRESGKAHEPQHQ